MIWSHLRILREKARAVIHTGCLWNYVSQKVPNDFICYLMNKYELYLTFSIIIISLTPDRDWDGAAACRAKPFTARASSDWDRLFEIGLLETADQTSQSDYRHDNDRYPINRNTRTWNLSHIHLTLYTIVHINMPMTLHCYILKSYSKKYFSYLFLALHDECHKKRNLSYFHP